MTQLDDRDTIYLHFSDAVYRLFLKNKYGIHCHEHQRLQEDIDKKEISDWLAAGGQIVSQENKSCGCSN